MDSPSSRAKVLVVAPNADLRHSLAFMLSAEGFNVESRSAWQTGDDVGCNQAMVADHGGFPKRLVDNGALDSLGGRLVVLASSPVLPPALQNATLIRKPLQAEELVSALRSALARPTT
jgi:hypothetical protein